MKVKERVLILSFGFILLVAGLGVVYRLAVDQATWRPSDIYNEVGGSYYSSVSSSSSASDGVAVSMRSGMRSSRRRVKMPVFSNAHSASSVGVNAGSNLPSLQGGAGVGPLYTTSSHMAKSFGSGFATGTAAPAFVASNVERPTAAVLSVPSVDASQYAGVYTYNSLSSAVSSVGADAAPVYRGLSGRKNAPPTTGGGWDKWLDKVPYMEDYIGEDGVKYYDYQTLYNAFIEAQRNGNFPGWTWEQFLENFFNPSEKYDFPLGEAWVLLVMALGYALVMWIRSRRVVTKKVLND